MYDVPTKSYSGLKIKSNWSVELPGIDLAHEKNAIFAVTGRELVDGPDQGIELFPWSSPFV